MIRPRRWRRATRFAAPTSRPLARTIRPLDDCKSIECSDLPRQPLGCQTQFKIYYDCRQAQADICINPDEATEECFAEFNDLLTCSSA